MRIIDADDLKKAIWDESHSIAIFTECGTEEAQFGLTVNEIEYTIDNAPTIERPKGGWIIIDDTEKFIAKCSVCGRIEDSRMVKDYPFCHCGADMRGDKE